MSDSKQKAHAIAEVLANHNGNEVAILDVGEQSGWTDFFVITTVTSSAHMRGLERFLDECVTALDMPRLNRPRLAEDEEWALFDFGDVVVHLMSAHMAACIRVRRRSLYVEFAPGLVLRGPISLPVRSTAVLGERA